MTGADFVERIQRAHVVYSRQLQQGKGIGEEGYNGMIDCFRKIIRNEGYESSFDRRVLTSLRPHNCFSAQADVLLAQCISIVSRDQCSHLHGSS